MKGPSEVRGEGKVSESQAEKLRTNATYAPHLHHIHTVRNNDTDLLRANSKMKYFFYISSGAEI